MKKIIVSSLVGLIAAISISWKSAPPTEKTLFQNVTIIDGNGGQPKKNMDILVQNGRIEKIAPHIQASDAKKVNLAGKTIMPALISDHVHIGSLKGLGNKAENYTRENILSQLKKYQDYGVLNILVMGSDRPMLFKTGLRDSSENVLLSGARIHSAGYGFGLENGAPPIEFAMDHVYRPSSPNQVPAEMDSLIAATKPTVVKLWVDDFLGKYDHKMSPAIYKTIIEQAHLHHLRAASHVYYLSDTRQLVNDGVDIIGHSVRDSIIDDNTIKEIKRKGIYYIPTLSLDEFAYIFARKPEWINNPFFKASLEPGVYEMITSTEYQDKLKNAPNYQQNMLAFQTALKNLKKLYDAGVLIAMGTDSGAMPLRAQGFSEHLELQLMVEAGLTPLQAITIGTKNAATLLKLNNQFGTIEKGKVADFLILNGDPSKNIKETRDIYAVYKNGQKVSNGPIAK